MPKASRQFCRFKHYKEEMKLGLNAKKVAKGNTGGGQRQEPIEAGTYPCRVVQVLDLGMQAQRPYQGQEKPPAHEIMVTYEFLDEFCLDKDGNEDEDKPRWLSETFPLRNLEQDLAKSTKRYKALDPDDVHDGDFTALVGSPCMVTVVNNPGKGANADKVYTNIAGVSTMRPKEAKKAAELVNDPKVFVLDEPDLEVFGSLPEWLQDKVKGNLEYEGSELEKALEGGSQKPKKEEEPVVEEEEDDDGEW